ncbi:MAG TPA: acyl-CoA dehydrogenase family protein [Mycobacteriales bacterium]|nr:acyl-CoA dehydrogenase family protein [Mycobacteriales bacterium]
MTEPHTGSRIDERQARQVAEASRETEWTKPSFGKELFLGRLQVDLIHPYPEPEPEAVERGEAFLRRLEEFLRAEVDPLEIERTAKIPDQVVKGLADIGAFGMKIPQEYGGLGLSYLYYNRALAMTGQAHSSLSALLSAHQSIGVPQPLALAGTEEQKRKYLPRCAAGEVSAFLLTEPDVGSDPARMRSTAVPSEDGTYYTLNGTKLWTTNGVIASLLVVMATVPKSEGHRGGITAFIVEADSPGIEVLHRNSFMGLRGIENGVTQFTDVRIPAENVVGDEGRGLKIALTTLNTGRLSLPAICAGAANWSLKIAREWGAGREQWGRPVGEHEAVAVKIANIAGMAFGLESVVELSSLIADQGSKDIRIEAALAKLYCSEHGWQVVDDLVQIRGGRGYETAASLAARGERPVGVEQALRDMRINRIFEGSSEIMRLLIAREAVDAHLSVAGDIIDPDKALADKARTAVKAGGFYAKWLPTLAVGKGTSPRSYTEFGDLAGHIRFVERSVRKLARSTFWGMSRWQGKLERKQAFLGRLVDIGAELYAISATVCRARMMAERSDPHAEAAGELAEVFCRGARRRVDRLFHELWANDDAVEYATARKVLTGRYTFLEENVLDLSGDELPLINKR